MKVIRVAGRLVPRFALRVFVARIRVTRARRDWDKGRRG
jgi:hypothetical protein